MSEGTVWTFTFLNIADISTTIIALRRGAYELNPVARWFISRLGLKSLFALKYTLMGLMLFIAFMLNEDLCELVIWMWNIILGGITAWNSYISAKLSMETIEKRKR